MKDEELRVEAMRMASGILCAPGQNPKPAEVLDAAKTIYDWLKG